MHKRSCNYKSHYDLSSPVLHTEGDLLLQKWTEYFIDIWSWERHITDNLVLLVQK